MIGKVVRSLSLGILSLSFWGSLPKPYLAQTEIIPDNSLAGEISTVEKQGNTVLIEGGATRDINLFHSFEEFNIGEGDSAYFLIDSTAIESIFSRITGSAPTNILGTLGTCLQGACPNDKPGASLYLTNPNGVTFGPNSQVDIGGSLVVTTADAIEFTQGETFGTEAASSPSALMSVHPSAFLFNQLPSQDIVNQSLAPAGTDASGQVNFQGLRVPDQENLIFLGGDIELNASRLTALGGQVELLAIGGPSRIPLQHNLTSSPELAIDDGLDDGLERGDISLVNSNITVANNGGGNILAYGNNITLSNSALIAGIGAGQGVEETQAGNIIIDATALVGLNTGFIVNIGLFNQAGNTGDIDITAEDISLLSGSGILTSNLGLGNAGNIEIIVTDQFIARGIDPNSGNRSAILSGSVPGILGLIGAGTGGDITVEAHSISLEDGATLISSGFASEQSGDIKLTSFSSIDLNNLASISSRTIDQTQGGSILVTTPSLTISNGAGIDSNTLGTGNAGAISIVAQDGSVSVTGESSFIEAGTIAAGEGGSLSIETGKLRVDAGAHLSAASGPMASGDAGDLTINATESIEVIGSSPGGSLSRIDTDVRSFNDTTGGQLHINTRDFIVRDGAQISSSVFGVGTAGELIVSADTIELTGESNINNGNFEFPGGLFAIVNTDARGQGGTLRVNARQLNISNGSKVQTITFGEGNAGDLFIDADEINISGTDEQEFTTGIFTGLGIDPRNTVPPQGEGGQLAIEADRILLQGNAAEISSAVAANGVGSAGDVSIETNVLLLQDSSQISAESRGSGAAGNIDIKVMERLALSNSNILTESTNSIGGDILVNISESSAVGVLVLRGDSDITTNSAGNGGNVVLLLPVVTFDDSDILARSDSADGGNITLGSLFTDNLSFDSQFPFDGDGKVDINAEGQTSSGTVTTPDTSFIQNDLSELASSLVTPEALISNSCIVQSEGDVGSFLISSLESLSNVPDTGGATTFSTGTVSSIEGDNTATLFSAEITILEPQRIFHLTDGRLLMSRECS